MRRLRFWVVGLIVGFAAASLLGSSVQSGVSSHRAVINQYCVGCHNDKAKTADLALDTLSVDNAGAKPEVWEKVVRKLRGRMMPPPGRPRPDEKSYDELVSYLEESLDRAAVANPNPGRTETFRRLNRSEYQNAIRDLLALDVDIAALLPKDDASFGFDNVGAGGLSATLLERYLAAAQKISRLAVGAAVRAPAANVSVLPVDFTQENHVEGLPFGTRGGTVVPYTFPLDGEYEIQVRLMRNRNENVEGLTEPHEMEVLLDGERVSLFTVRPNRTGVGGVYYSDQDVDKNLRIRVPVKAGPHSVAAAFLMKTGALIETERQPYLAHFNMDRHPRVQPAVYSVSTRPAQARPRAAVVSLSAVRQRRSTKNAALPASFRRWPAERIAARSAMKMSGCRSPSIKTRGRAEISSPGSKWRCGQFSPARSF
jgi:mono/diheme cytochrome c family protein